MENEDKPCIFVKEGRNTWHIIYADQYEEYKSMKKRHAPMP